MRRISIISVLMALVLSIGFISCEKDPDIDDSPIPQSGLYFKMKLGDDMMWRGNNLPTMYAKSEAPGEMNKFFDFVVCTQSLTDTNVTKLDQYLILHVKVNPDGSFSNYNVQYYEDRVVDQYPIEFSKLMYYKSGKLTLTENKDNKLSGKFEGKMQDIYDNEDIREIVIEFQEFPLSPVKKK